jgi:hypothetical protein
MNLPMPCPIVRTEYKGPTNHRGARVVATHVTNPRMRATVAWDHALGSAENHYLAARAVAAELDAWSWSATSMAGTDVGYLFVFARLAKGGK